MLTLFAECYINPASYGQEYGSRFVLLNKGNKVLILKLVQWKLLSSWLWMLWEFIYMHTHIYFYLILKSLPPYLLKKLSVNHIISKEFCMGKACKSRQHGNIQYPSITSLPHICHQAQRLYMLGIFSQQIQLNLSHSQASFILISKEEQPQPSRLLAIPSLLANVWDWIGYLC